MTIHFATTVYFAMLQVARPSSALVVVDVQNDFISGSLAIINCPAGQNGEDVSSVDIVMCVDSVASSHEEV